MDNKIQIIGFNEYILSHRELARQNSKGEFESDNILLFECDYKSGALNLYKGTFVLYHKGVLCGQSKDGELLIKKATSYYGASNLTAIHVPEELSGLEDSVINSFGK